MTKGLRKEKERERKLSLCLCLVARAPRRILRSWRTQPPRGEAREKEVLRRGRGRERREYPLENQFLEGISEGISFAYELVFPQGFFYHNE